MVPDITAARQPAMRRRTTAMNFSKSAGSTARLSSTSSVCVPAASSMTVMHWRVGAFTVTKSDSISFSAMTARRNSPRSPPRKPVATGCSPSTLSDFRHVDGLAGGAIECDHGPVHRVGREFAEEHHPLRGGGCADAENHVWLPPEGARVVLFCLREQHEHARTAVGHQLVFLLLPVRAGWRNRRCRRPQRACRPRESHSDACGARGFHGARPARRRCPLVRASGTFCQFVNVPTTSTVAGARVSPPGGLQRKTLLKTGLRTSGFARKCETGRFVNRMAARLRRLLVEKIAKLL